MFIVIECFNWAVYEKMVKSVETKISKVCACEYAVWIKELKPK